MHDLDGLNEVINFANAVSRPPFEYMLYTVNVGKRGAAISQPRNDCSSANTWLDRRVGIERIYVQHFGFKLGVKHLNELCVGGLPL